ncbi:unnamed protein product [Symbiodinium sp. CCMP2456]|nr:unnamed protein product [Symbiodinium sp. CCMP2456]
MHLVRPPALTCRPSIPAISGKFKRSSFLHPTVGQDRVTGAIAVGLLHSAKGSCRNPHSSPRRISAALSISGGMETACQGEVFLYDEMLGYAGFEARTGGVPEGSKAVVCIGGLTDGLLSLRYLPALAAELQQVGWRTFQPVLQSSYRGWGFASLDDDVLGIDKFLSFLRSKRGITEVVLLGSSTGCQDAVHYLKVGKLADIVHGIVLQAPVSDREALSVETSGNQVEALREFAQTASKMIAEGRGEEPLPRAACQLFGPPDVITAYRFDSLTRRLADDDMFSSDLSADEMKQKLGHVHTPALLIASADDEYVPKTVDVSRLCHRMADAMAAGVARTAECLVLQQGGHGVRGQDAQARFVDAVARFVARLSVHEHHELPDSLRLSRLTWEVSLANTLRGRAASLPSGEPLLVALAGMPGSGKSRISQILLRLLQPDCLVVQMDGYHTKLSDLQSRPDAVDAVYRRGAPDTFEVSSLKEALKRVKAGESSVKFPAFDHARGDPVEDAVCFDRRVHRIVLVEGLYLLHRNDGWQEIPDLFDFKVYLDADLEECIGRVKERNKVIPGYTPQEIDKRCEEVDRRNAEVVQLTQGEADLHAGRRFEARCEVKFASRLPTKLRSHLAAAGGHCLREHVPAFIGDHSCSIGDTAVPLVRQFIKSRYKDYGKGTVTLRHLKEHIVANTNIGLTYEDLRDDRYSSVIEDEVDAIVARCDGGKKPVACLDTAKPSIEL